MSAAIETTATELTPELLDLFEHEKVIEQGLASFIDITRVLHSVAYARNGNAHRPTRYYRWRLTVGGEYQGQFLTRKAAAAAAEEVSIMAQEAS